MRKNRIYTSGLGLYKIEQTHMKIEIVVVIIASISSLIVGLINIVFNARISAKQNELELKKTRIDLLESRRLKIETVKTEIANRVIDVSDIKDLTDVKYFPRLVDFFQKNSSSILSVGHLVDPQFIKELKLLNHKISDNIDNAKQQIHTDPIEIKKDI